MSNPQNTKGINLSLHRGLTPFVEKLKKHVETIRSDQSGLLGPVVAIAFFQVISGFISIFFLMQGSITDKSLLIVQLILLLISISICVLFIMRAYQRFLRPLTHLKGWLQYVRNGDLSARIPVPNKGAFTDIAKGINQLCKSLNTKYRNMDQQVRIQTERMAQKTRSLEILYDAAAGINDLHSLDELLTRFLHTLKDLVHAQAAVVRLINDEGKMRLVSSFGLDPAVEQAERVVPITSCLNGMVIADGLMLQTNIRLCGNISKQPSLNSDDMVMIAIPIQNSGKDLGVYNMFVDNPDIIGRKDIQYLFTSIGRHLGIAIEKAKLENHARRLSIMEERTLLANELHDSLAQTLASLRFQVAMVEETVVQSRERTGIRQIRIIKDGLDLANNQLRELLAHFRTRMDERGLIPAIESLVEKFEQETGIIVFFQNETKEFKLLPALEVQVLHIVQEALANVRKHSQAENVRILIRSDNNGNYLVLVEDDGQGIKNIEKNAGPGEHVGLSIMRERAKRLAGELSIESEPGEGTRVELTFQAQNQRVKSYAVG